MPSLMMLNMDVFVCRQHFCFIQSLLHAAKQACDVPPQEIRGHSETTQLVSNILLCLFHTAKAMLYHKQLYQGVAANAHTQTEP